MGLGTFLWLNRCTSGCVGMGVVGIDELSERTLLFQREKGTWSPNQGHVNSMGCHYCVQFIELLLLTFNVLFLLPTSLPLPHLRSAVAMAV